ncbi:MAG TPA: heat-inducible transcriptional repressor HrcA [Aggregatilineales bacterium]|nr:heat-inducible transcriptional repressor HrcA [Aggregatilineales bacterium]
MIPDEAKLPELTERQQKILALIVRAYINKPEPIGSKYLADSFLTDISSATIRNEMATLEELGLIVAPHTSAGRIPTETGYRYFVRWLLDDRELPADEQHAIAVEFEETRGGMESWMQLAVSSLARISRAAALVTAPRAYTNQFKHVELIATQGRLVLMVLVLHGGEVRQQMLTLTDAPTQETLGAVSARLNTIAAGLTSEQIHSRLSAVDSELERAILEVIADTLDAADESAPAIAYRDGLSVLLPELMSNEGAQQALQLMEGRSLLSDIMSETGDRAIGHVHVLIAGEGRWAQVRHLSLVLSSYGVAGQVTGTLAVLGPTRMRYGRAISGVRYISGLMSSKLLRAYGIDSEGDDSSSAQP